MGAIAMLAGGALQRQFYHGCFALDASWAERFMMGGNSVMAAGPIEDCGTAADLCVWLERFTCEMGFDGGRYLHIGHRAQGSAAADRPPLRFLSTLENEQDPWRAGDPTLPQVVHNFVPFAWTTEDDLSLPDQQRAWLSIERLRGVRGGIAMPVQDYLSGPAFISLFGTSADEATRIAVSRGPEMLALAIEFHCRAKTLLPAQAERPGALTDRELSCLRHAASGATLVETAGSLGIAPRTVELHFARATRKLGAANRINAVATAIGSGFISI